MIPSSRLANKGRRINSERQRAKKARTGTKLRIWGGVDFFNPYKFLV